MERDPGVGDPVGSSQAIQGTVAGSLYTHRAVLLNLPKCEMHGQRGFFLAFQDCCTTQEQRTQHCRVPTMYLCEGPSKAPRCQCITLGG